MSKGSILIVDDESEIREGLELLLNMEGYSTSSAETGEAGLALLEENPFDLVLLDVSLPDRNGLELLLEIRQRDPNLSVVLITAYGSIDMARAAFKSGAQDYITKPWSNDELLAQVAQAVEARRLRDENLQLKRALKQRFNFHNIIGKSDKMLTLFDLVTQVAPSRSTVLISGESGTGKELIARAIYQHSLRAQAPFLAVNCAAIPEALLESELFGHEKGSFTGAVRKQTGKFVAADGGTIFLDEIGDMPLAMQSKLLRVLQEGEVRPVGSNQTLRVDVRVVAATNKNLPEMVRSRTFREDLYFRLNVITIRLPPLRERGSDVRHIALAFAAKAEAEVGRKVSLSEAALAALERWTWPGNVRELENVIRRAAVFAKGPIGAVDLSAPIGTGT
jgi:DNA-binding NtrC family response regulator